jgi:outer membrane protein W
MTVPVLLLTAAIAAAQQGVPVPPPAAPTIAARFDPGSLDQQRQSPRQGPDDSEGQSTERPHQVGLGAQMGLSNRGGGGAFRVFMTPQLGVNFSATYYPGARYNTINGSVQGSTFAVMPSVMYMVTKPNLLRDVDLRPYVGGGINYVHASRPVPTTVPGALALVSENGMGGQVFGGVEMTFRSADYITISFEGTYYRLAVDYQNAALRDGFTYALAFHFYLK